MDDAPRELPFKRRIPKSCYPFTIRVHKANGTLVNYATITVTLVFIEILFSFEVKGKANFEIIMTQWKRRMSIEFNRLKESGLRYLRFHVWNGSEWLRLPTSTLDELTILDVIINIALNLQPFFFSLVG